MDKRVHVKVFCEVCGKLLKHEALDPIMCKNFFMIQVGPCSDCLQGGYDRGFEDRFEHDKALFEERRAKGKVIFYKETNE